MNRMWKVKVAMSVLIDKSVCPHASGQRTAMHVCDERGRGRGRGALLWTEPMVTLKLIIYCRVGIAGNDFWGLTLVGVNYC